MAELTERHMLSVQDLENQLGVNRLPIFIEEAESDFLSRTQEVVAFIASHPSVQAVFVSGPTSSGKTTFTERLTKGLKVLGRASLRLSLDDYYDIKDVEFDSCGRPDYESVSTIDTRLAGEDLLKLLSGEAVNIPEFNFKTRQREWPEAKQNVSIDSSGIVVTEGLHGLADEVCDVLPRDKWIGVFIMPNGGLVADKKLFGSDDFRLLRRIVRDQRHRGAHALSTIDYWPMIESSEKAYYENYLKKADFYINSFLLYESLVIAPIAKKDIEESLEALEKGVIEPSVFLKRTIPPKPFADIDTAVARARLLHRHLSMVPEINHERVPEHSILQEFIGAL
ncbi:MAG: hypothetical protein GXY06_08800 [Clostridiaceae bacterium]|nr:hypothetical protein [Clostridiaceae bacterium]